MNKVTALLILAITTFACQTMTKHRFKGKYLPECPSKVPSDALSFYAIDTSIDIAEADARDRLTNELEPPKSVSKMVGVLGRCVMPDTGKFKVIVGITKDSALKARKRALNTLKSAIDTKGLSPLKSLRLLYNASGAIDDWNAAATFLTENSISGKPINAASIKKKYFRTLGKLKVAVKFANDTDPMLASQFRRVFSQLGLKITQGKVTAPDIQIKIAAINEPIPKSENSRFTYMNLVVVLNVTDHRGVTVSEVNWIMKGGGLDNRQALTSARTELTKKLRNDLLSDLFKGAL